MSTEGSKWWWSALSAAKEKSVLAINATRRDLSEFVSVLQNDTASAISSVGTNLKGFVQPVPEQDKPTMTTAPRTAHDTAPQTGRTGYDRSSARLYSMQNDPVTYLNVPAGEEPLFCKWKETFNIQDHQTEISQLLVSAPHVRTLHSQLVPARISYELFWQRYWFNITRMKQEEQKRAQLVARVATKDEQWLWDDEPDDASDVCVVPASLHEQRSESSESFVCVTDDSAENNPTVQSSCFDSNDQPPLHPTDFHQPPLHPTDLNQPPLHPTDLNQPPLHPTDLQQSPLHPSQDPDKEDKEPVDCSSPKPSQNSDSDWERWDD